MRSYSFKLPDVGEGIAEAEIVAWHVQPGDILEEDALLADVMTDKATIELTSPVAGKVIELGGEVGHPIAIGAVLAVFEIAGEAEAPLELSRQSGDEASVCSDTASSPPQPLTEPAVETLASHAPAPTLASQRVVASPAVRGRAKALEIDLAQVRTADGGRIRHSDLDAYLSYGAERGYAPAGAVRADEQVKVIGLRRRIAENMAASKRAIPHFTYVEEIDVTKLEALRTDLNGTRGAKPKLTMLPLLITGICKALPDFPIINARFDDDAGIVTRFGAVHLGIAVQTDAGLMVPVVRNAHDLNLWQLASEISRLAEAARSGKATSAELSGSTLTITSLGALGGIATTPVINRPEVAIIGPNKVVERPVFRDGRVEAAKLMNLSISCDHRVVDGWDAASYVQALKRLLETPALLFAD